MRAAKMVCRTLMMAGLLAGIIACSGGNIDDGKSANVVLTVLTWPNIPPVTTTYNTELGRCVFTLPAAVQVTLANSPKSELASKGPYSDVVVEQADVTYLWDTNEAPVTRTQSISGTIRASSSGTVPFTPILLGDLNDARAGHSANMAVVFRGHTVDGTAVNTPEGQAGGVLSVNACVGPVCGDGLINGSEQCDDQNTNSGDGCSSACQVEQGYRCEGQPSVCTPIIPIP